MNDFVVVIQGQSTNVQEQKEAWKGFDILFSTWIGQEDKYTAEDNVIYNPIPTTTGPANFNYQLTSTQNGLLKAKELGYKHVLKIRSDMIPTNAKNFVSLLDESKLNFLCWHASPVYPSCNGYLVDYLMSGAIDDMIQLWDIPNIFCVVPEVMLTWQYINACKQIDIRYFINELHNENDLWWIKNNTYLSSYKQGINTSVHSTYNTDTQHLNGSYLNFLK
jgi:hypothetical protein